MLNSQACFAFLILSLIYFWTFQNAYFSFTVKGPSSVKTKLPSKSCYINSSPDQGMYNGAG